MFWKKGTQHERVPQNHKTSSSSSDIPKYHPDKKTQPQGPYPIYPVIDCISNFGFLDKWNIEYIIVLAEGKW